MCDRSLVNDLLCVVIISTQIGKEPTPCSDYLLAHAGFGAYLADTQLSETEQEFWKQE